MLGFIKVSPAAEPLARRGESFKEELWLSVRAAIAIAVMLALLALAFGIRLWVYFPHG
jgi:hypothetical protein